MLAGSSERARLISSVCFPSTIRVQPISGWRVISSRCSRNVWPPGPSGTRALGDPMRLARELRAEVGFRRWEQNRNAGNFLGVVLALLGLATIDFIILLPLLCGLAAIFERVDA